MPERIEAVLQLRELGRRITTRSPRGNRKVLEKIAMSQDHNKPRDMGVLEREKLDLDCAECGTQAAQFSWPQILGEGLFRFEETIRTYIKHQEITDKQLDQLQLKLVSS